MLIFGIILGVAAGAGSFIMGYIDDYIGPKKMIQISNFLLLIATIIVVFVNDETFFWIAGILVGLLLDQINHLVDPLCQNFALKIKK